jgi:hypothetical protein
MFKTRLPFAEKLTLEFVNSESLVGKPKDLNEYNSRGVFGFCADGIQVCSLVNPNGKRGVDSTYWVEAH